MTSLYISGSTQSSQASHKCAILLLQAPEYTDYRSEPIQLHFHCTHQLDKSVVQMRQGLLLHSQVGLC